MGIRQMPETLDFAGFSCCLYINFFSAHPSETLPSPGVPGGKKPYRSRKEISMNFLSKLSCKRGGFSLS